MLSLVVATALAAPGASGKGEPVPPTAKTEPAPANVEGACISNAPTSGYTLVLCVSHGLRAPFAARTFANYACRGELKGTGFLKRYGNADNPVRIFRACIAEKSRAALKRLVKAQATASRGCLADAPAGAVLQEAAYATPRAFTIYMVRGAC